MTDNKSRNGLSSEEVIASRQKHGSNTMSKRKSRSLIGSFLDNLKDPVIRVLMIALVVNIIFTFKSIDLLETGGIAVAILLSTAISTLSERSSAAAFERLSKSTQGYASARRNGRITEIGIDEIVVGDVILLCAGDKINADGYLLSGEIGVDQSSLTGESKEARKLPIKSKDAVDLSPSSKHSCLRGCLVSSGEGEMLVTRVGDASFLGGIVGELQAKTRESPLKLRLNKLAKQISALGYGAAALIALLSFFSSIVIQSDFTKEVILSKLNDPQILAGELLHSLTLALTVVIMAVPEGLPMMIAVVLSSNVQKMLKDNVLVRKQTGIEAAGSMNILFTDKTGTLTRGKMYVEGFILPDATLINSVSELKRLHKNTFSELCDNVIYNSSAQISGKQIIGGNATERALLEAVRRHINPDYSRNAIKLPFNSVNKYSSATLGEITYNKGAPEVIISSLNDTDFNRSLVEKEIYKAQAEGKRVIALSKNSTFTCAAIISDPPRREARSSVEKLRNAGIATIMITGDGLTTAKSIAERVGIITPRRSLCLTHEELEAMTDEELSEVLPRLALLSRALPQDKSRLVRISQKKELVVGMTGDGINDAPALKLSDVGFAMGSGTDVAKDAGDIVILDNDLASIVKAVLYGRNIFKSIRKFLVFQLTMNFSSALVCMIAPLFGYDTPITVTQMLWVNMIMDTLGGLAFAGEAPQKWIMKERPKRRDEPILNKYMIHQIAISGSFSAFISILFLKLPFFYENFRKSESDSVLLSAFFGLFIFLGVMQSINSRTDRLNLFNGITKNPTFVLIMMLILAIQISFIYFGGAILRATPLLINELLFTLLVASLAIPFELLRKAIWRFSGHTEGF